MSENRYYLNVFILVVAILVGLPALLLVAVVASGATDWAAAGVGCWLGFNAALIASRVLVPRTEQHLHLHVDDAAQLVDRRTA